MNTKNQSAPLAHLNPRKILVVSLEHLGDLIFSTGLISPLLERYPEAIVDVWCRKYTAAICRLAPGVRKIHISEPFWEREWKKQKGIFKRHLKTLKAVRRERYDLALIPSLSWKVSASVAFARIPVRIGYRRRQNFLFQTHPQPHQNPNLPVMRELGRLLEPLGIFAKDLRYRLDSSLLDPRKRALAGLVPWERVVVVHPFASHDGRTAPIPSFFQLADFLITRNLHPLWIGKPDELERIRYATSQWGTDHFIDTLGSGEMGDADAAISMAKFSIGSDSGPLHIASGFGIPCLGIHTVKFFQRCFPQGVSVFQTICKDSPEDITGEDLIEGFEKLQEKAGG